jgi:hypothetical protein
MLTSFVVPCPKIHPSYLDPYLLAAVRPSGLLQDRETACASSLTGISSLCIRLITVSHTRKKSRPLIATHAQRTKFGMDDHHHQPIWPMIQGAANYAWNLIEEALAMLWSPADAAREQMVRAQPDRGRCVGDEMREVSLSQQTAGDLQLKEDRKE